MSLFLEVLECIGCIGFPYFGGLLGSVAINNNVSWYDSLEKPIFTPPSWVFGVVWGIMYGIIGLASYLVLRERRNETNIVLPISAYLVHLALNWAWTPVFFGLQQIQAAIGIIVAVTISAIFTSILFGMVNKVAGWLFVPYLIWLVFATALNISIGVLNPTQP